MQFSLFDLQLAVKDEESEPEEGEEPPIELKNKPVMRPFEVITEMYGMPHAKEVDPTPLAGPFFALFFGFCITDAGYGIVLVALSLPAAAQLAVVNAGLCLLVSLALVALGAISSKHMQLQQQANYGDALARQLAHRAGSALTSAQVVSMPWSQSTRT